MTKAEKLQLHRIMENLDWDEETAKNVLESDKRIDKGEKLFELNENQKRAEKKMRSVGCKTVNPYGKPTVREKPQDRQKSRFRCQRSCLPHPALLQQAEKAFFRSKLFPPHRRSL